MSNGNTDRNSPYYYGTDSTYRPKTVQRKPARNNAPQYEMGLDGIPRLVGNSKKRGGGLANLGPEYAAQERHEFNKARAHDIKTKDPSVTSLVKSDPVNEETIITGPIPESTRKVNGIVQKGINMSRSFNDLLNGVGQQPFGGSQLPTTMGNTYTATYKQTQGFGDEIPDIGGYNGATFDSELGRLAASSKDISQFAPMTRREVPIDGGAERIGLAATGITSSRLSDALNSVRSEVEMTPERRQQMARAAFLDTKGSQAGLRAKEAVNNVVYAGGKHYIPGESADSPAVFIDRSQARDISRGRSSAQSLLEEHIAKNKDVGEDTPASAQNPLSEAGDAIKSAFAAGAQTDFALNNNQGAPQTGVGPVVPTDKIPKNLSGAAGREFLRKLDAGELF